MRVLVTGVGGYIGSILAATLIDAGHEVHGIDNFVGGVREAVPDGVALTTLDLRDHDAVMSLVRETRPDAVAHLAADALIEASMRDPIPCFATNVSGSLHLLEGMVGAGVERIVFASSASVYGQPAEVPVSEEHALLPVSPYGESKRSTEAMLQWLHATRGLRYVAFRFFNVAGAVPPRGEQRPVETHLLPLLLDAADGTGPPATLFGSDYDTPDGTPVRDYVHVGDVTRAFAMALDFLEREPYGAGINLGSGTGFSVLEIVRAVERVTGREVPRVSGPRRPGDPARIVAAITRAEHVLGWRPERSTLDRIIESAWAWRSSDRVVGT